MLRSTLLCTLTLFLLFSCGRRQTTVLIDSWTDSDIVSPGYDKLLVIGVSPNPEGRKAFEERMKKDLQKRKIQAISWLEVLSAEEEVSRETYQQYFEEADIDAVMVTRVLEVNELPMTVPSNRNKRPPSELYDNFYNYYRHVKVEQGQPKAFQPGAAVFLETNVFDAETADLVWAGQSKSFFMHKPQRVIKDISKVVSGVLVEEGVLKRSR